MDRHRPFLEGLPDVLQLASYKPPVVSRIYAGDGRLLAEYATENRVFVPIAAMPKRVINAFLAAEDKTFYTHPGVDVPGVIAAALTNLKNLGDDRRPVGAFDHYAAGHQELPAVERGVLQAQDPRDDPRAAHREGVSQDRILELYLNQIYLGSGNYGVATAALNYFNKSLDELTIGEAAYLGALPKAPNNYNIVRDHQAALDRRNWVIDRMREDGHITAEEAEAAKQEPLETHARAETEHVVADYFAEEVRREIVQRFQRTGSTRAASRSAPPSIPGCRRSPTACCASIWSPTTRPRAIAARCSMSTASRTGRRRWKACRRCPGSTAGSR
jgi:penicillin-binding protein 1A